MNLQLFLHRNLAVHFLYSPESIKDSRVKVKNLCIVLPGLPNLISKEYFEPRVNKETAFLSVYYYGTWLSGGKFTFKNCKKTIKDSITFAKSKIGIKTFDGEVIRWDFKNLFIIGYSFAANPILTTEISKDDVRAVLLYAPFIYTDKNDISQILDESDTKKFISTFQLFLEFLRRGYKYALRGINDFSWFRYFTGNEPLSKIKLFSDFPPIYIYHGLKDDQVDPEFSEYFSHSYRKLVKLFLVKNAGHSKEIFSSSHLDIK